MVKNVRTSKFDKFVDEIQSQIRDEEREVFSETVIQEFDNPSNVGWMEDADGEGELTGPCNDTMWMFVRIKDGKVADVLFNTDGCGATIACGSMLTKMLCGLSLEEAGKIGPEDLIAALDGLPNAKMHCAKLTVSTLQRAIANWDAEEV